MVIDNIIHITDIHLNPLNKIPQACSESYHDIVYNEFAELRQQIQKYKGNSIIVITGDIFNLKTQSLYSPRNVNYYIKLFEDTFEGFQVFTIPGNHDLPKSTFSLLDETIYKSVTSGARNVTDISYTTFEFDNIRLLGFPYSDMDTFKEKIQQQITKDKLNIALCHQDIYPTDNDTHFTSNNHLTFQQIIELNQNIDMFLLGHIHKEFEPININDALFSKPHAFSRTNKHYLEETDIKDSYPSYNVINILTMEVKTFRIEKYKASDFMNFDIVKTIKEQSNKFQYFLEELRNTGTKFTIENADDTLNKIEMEKDIKDIVETYLNMVE